MLKLKKNCKVCQAVKQNKRLLNEIYNTKYYLKTRGPSLAETSQKYPHLFTYDGLKNHVKKHQFLDAEDFTQRHLSDIAKKAEQQILMRKIESVDVWDTVIDKGMEKLESGELTMKTADLLKAAKDKQDYQFKQTDQKMAMMDMVFHFASGENDLKERRPYDGRLIEGQAADDYDPAAEPAGLVGERPDGPGAFYQSLAGDAAAPGPDKVPARDPETTF